MEENSVKKQSTIETLGKAGVKATEKLGKGVVEWFTGKPLTPEQIEEKKLEREHQAKLRHIQNEARRRKELELAERGEYVPPEKPKKKDSTADIFLNLGKHNPLEGFDKSASIGKQTFGVEGYSGIKPVRKQDLNLNLYEEDPLR